MLSAWMTTHRTTLVIVCAAAFAVAVIAALLGVDRARKPEPGVSVTLAVPDNTSAALVYLARDKGFFADEGVDVELVKFTAGHLAIDDILPGRAQMAVSADMPVVYRSFEAADFVILGSIAASDQAYAVVARRDHGISVPADLARRVVATEQGGPAHFFLDALLEDAGLLPEDVEVRFMDHDEAIEALRAGRVDAVSTLESVARGTADELGASHAVVLGEFGRQRQYTLLLATRELVETDEATVVAILRALVRAERFVRSRPHKARVAVARQLGRETTAEVEHAWADYRFQISASFGTLISLESQAEWVAGLLPESVPTPVDFLDLFFVEPLREVRPAAVGIWN